MAFQAQDFLINVILKITDQDMNGENTPSKEKVSLTENTTLCD